MIVGEQMLNPQGLGRQHEKIRGKGETGRFQNKDQFWPSLYRTKPGPAWLELKHLSMLRRSVPKMLLSLSKP